MKNWNKGNNISILLLLTVFLYSCANMASPSGGLPDELPPRYVRSNPAPGQTGFTGKKIEIEFDELVQLDKPFENVIITPPQTLQPVIRSAGRKVIVEFKDSLKSNTTYTIDFTNSIADNNEKNVLENYAFSFSTGDVIDSLEVSGILLNAENLEPLSGVTVGLHENLDDSAFVKLPFSRISRTNDKGWFTIRNISTGTYRLFAVNDMNRDYKFDQPGEAIAFLDSVVVPSFELTTRIDTLWKDSVTVDTIMEVPYTHFKPDDILLRLFKEDFERQYMLKPERTEENRFSLRFNSPVKEIPRPQLLNIQVEDPDWYFAQPEADGKTIYYWLKDSTVWKQDTLEVAVEYPKSDSLNVLRLSIDTVKMVMRRRSAPKKKKKKDESDPIVFLGITGIPSGKVEVYDTLTLRFEEPVLELKKELISLDIKQDTLWNPVMDFDFFQDAVDPLVYHVKRKWEYGDGYCLKIDSAAIYSIYGKWNGPVTSEFSIKNKDEYGHLYINVNGVDTVGIVELLDKGDNVLRRQRVKNGGVLFWDLKPDKYYARILIDSNGNGKWDTGDYARKIQPEEVYYAPRYFEVPLNWQAEETWNVFEVPVNEQKPLEITKNKPKESTKKNRNYTDEKNNTRNNSSSGRNPGLSRL